MAKHAELNASWATLNPALPRNLLYLSEIIVLIRHPFTFHTPVIAMLLDAFFNLFYMWM